ncbi:MAG TPA: tetratricopeptide repeat protein, partial [Gemmataceae bacterium]|nr:tetratricopeptide repeat protein [Gemmataceae bacterium]
MIGRRFWAALAALLLVGGGAAGIWWWHSHSADPPPQPPAVNMPADEDPTLAKVFEDARAKVLKEPRSAEAWGFYGKVLLANGLGEDSRTCFAEAARLDTSDPRWPYFHGVAQQAIDPDPALSYFREAARRVGNDDGLAADAVRLRYAEALTRKGQAAEAEGLLREVLRHRPDEPRALLELGSLAMDAGDLDTAEANLLHCLRCPDSRLAQQRATTRLSRLYLQKGNKAEAERYRNLARSYPRDGDGPDPYSEEYKELLVGRRARLLRAEGLLRSGELQEAVG